MNREVVKTIVRFAWSLNVAATTLVFLIDLGPLRTGPCNGSRGGFPRLDIACLEPIVPFWATVVAGGAAGYGVWRMTGGTRPSGPTGAERFLVLGVIGAAAASFASAALTLTTPSSEYLYLPLTIVALMATTWLIGRLPTTPRGRSH